MLYLKSNLKFRIVNAVTYSIHICFYKYDILNSKRYYSLMKDMLIILPYLYLLLANRGSYLQEKGILAHNKNDSYLLF